MFSFLAFITGAVVSIQSRVAGELTKVVENGITAVAFSNYVGWVLLTILVFGIKRERAGFHAVIHALRTKSLRPWEVLGGWGGAIFIATQSTQVPILGVALFTITYIAGQTIFALIVDELGLTTNGKKKINALRVITSLITLIGVMVAVYPDLTSAQFAAFPIILVIVVGAATSLQQALNSRVNQVAQRPLVTAWFNFTVGGSLLTLVMGVRVWTGHPFGSLPTSPDQWWLYSGGLLGLIFIATTAYILKHLGMLKWGLVGVTGQLIGALLLDWIVPAHSGAINRFLIIGSLITLASVLGSRYFESRTSKDA
ncbi:MAG: hypothetical protein F2573_05695 [Actinobacteria bacterium]|uniref:Unannotated protein n=1 Tax=freshwater metagenome TaxID=449393 RepID=A0A6J6GC71_9ZZZZ|nr:hypothetical protein [Actinomycetota bacterium]MSY82861.1 hypothetical protein [Actinomycetota bacterium]MTA23054.1 hypothetical protein [Actinomycetota bacterium]